MEIEESKLQLLKDILAIEDFEQKTDLLKQNFDLLSTSISIEELENLETSLIIKSLLFTNLTLQKNYEKINQLINANLIKDLHGYKRQYDFFISKIIISLYMTYLYFKHDLSIFFNLLASNKELNNCDCVSVLTNIVIDILIKSKKLSLVPIHFIEMSNSEQQSIHNFYKGKYLLIKGDYTAALVNFQSAIILSNNKIFMKFVEKYVVVCLLLKSDLNLLKNYNWTIKNKYYFELYQCIKSGNIHLYNEIMEVNKENYVKDGTYSVLLRLYENVIIEGIRKIGICYARIGVDCIGELLSMESEEIMFLLEKCIQEDIIRGKINNNVFYSENKEIKEVVYGDKIKEVIILFNIMKGMMRYPKIKPLTYENIDKNNIAYDFNH